MILYVLSVNMGMRDALYSKSREQVPKGVGCTVSAIICMRMREAVSESSKYPRGLVGYT